MIIQKRNINGVDYFSTFNNADLSRWTDTRIKGPAMYGVNGGHVWDTLEHFRIAPDTVEIELTEIEDNLQSLRATIKSLEALKQRFLSAGFADGKKISKTLANQYVEGFGE